MTTASQILDILKTKDLQKELYEGDDAALLYHFSKARHNLLDWYDFSASKSLMQIGSGYGAMTELFAEKLAHVTCLTNDEKQEEIIEKRFENCTNVSVLCKEFEDFLGILSADESDDMTKLVKSTLESDYVFIEGVREGAWQFLNENISIDELLSFSRDILAKDGTLILALNNKLGLSFLAGDKDFEDREYYESLDSKKTNCFFTKEEITNHLKANGFSDIEFFYPWPNLRLPDSIYSDNYLPKPGELRTMLYGIGQKKYNVFDETNGFDALCQTNSFASFANSFLIFAK